ALENMKDVILEEINIKELIVLEDDSAVVNKTAKPNFKTLGPKFGKLMKELASKIKLFTRDEISIFEKEGKYTFNFEGVEVTLSSEDVEILSSEIEGWVVESEEGITVAIDTELTEELIAEGYAREFVNRIQNMRKDAGLDVMDRIGIVFNSADKFVEYINNFSGYIKTETLADTFTSGEANTGYIQKWNIGEFDCSISIEKLEK
ncbi:MAG: DUF5915 domain-containing protein, partial [bacterium]